MSRVNPNSWCSMSRVDAEPDSLKRLTVKDVADLFGIRPRKVHDLVRAGLPCVKVGRLFRFRRADLLRWLDSQVSAVGGQRAGTAAPAVVKRDWSRTR